MNLINPSFEALRREAIADPERFWARAAADLPWLRTWDRVLEWDPPWARWFLGAQTNLAYQCLDVQVANGRGGHAALICEDEHEDRRVLTYAQLLFEVRRVAAGLRGLGVKAGDRVAIYMPTCAEAIIAMLACVRIGAIHLVVFAGFGARAFADRLQLAGARVILTADRSFRKGKPVPLLGLVHEAVDLLGDQIRQVVVLRRSKDAALRPDRDLPWEDLLAIGEGQDGGYVALEANQPAYILATSGTTARPKLAVHCHGPYAVHIHSMGRWLFGLSPEDVFWATSDIGWAVGHSYMVYAPLLRGCTAVAFEGALDHPGPQTPYRIIEENGVTGLFTSPTAARLLMRHGVASARRHDLGSISRVFCAGEVLNPPAWAFLQHEVFSDRVPVIDHMWQTETGGPIVGNPYGLGLLPIKPGSSGVLLPGISGSIVTPEGAPCAAGERGIFVIDRPFPGLTPTLWGEPERYATDYFGRIPGRTVYFTGDATAMDADGYLWFSGRADEVIKIASHRIGTIEVESAFLAHAAVAEAGVTGRPDELRGEVIAAFIVLRPGHEPSPALRQALLETVRHGLGALAVIGDLNFVRSLPKTRSGKIMRRVLKSVVMDRDPGDLSTLEEEGSVEEARAAWQALRSELGA